MTKAEAMKQFREEILPAVEWRYGKNDKVAQSQAWNDFTDGLCKDKQITMKQYSSWDNPF